MPRMVQCVKLGSELPGLEKPPFPGELGKRIFENVSQQAWEMWPAQSTIIINHYSLNMADPSARKFLREQMEEFFFGKDVQMPDDWTPAQDLVEAGSNEKGGGSSKGGGGGGGASRKK